MLCLLAEAAVPQASWFQVLAVTLLILAALGALFRVLLHAWWEQRKKFEEDVLARLTKLQTDSTSAVALLRSETGIDIDKVKTKHEADINGLRNTFFAEIQVIRETWHKQNGETNGLIGRVANQVDEMRRYIADLQKDQHELVDKAEVILKELGEKIHSLDTSVALLTDRMNRRRDDPTA